MKLLYRILAIVLAISVIGNLMAGKLFVAGILLAAFCAYRGWKSDKVKVHRGFDDNGAPPGNEPAQPDFMERKNTPE